MNEKELLELGFKDNSYTDDEGNRFTEFYLQNNNFQISVMGIDLVEICLQTYWIEVSNCKKISDLKELIRLFS